MQTSQSRVALFIRRSLALASCAVILSVTASAQSVSKLTLSPTSVVGGTSSQGTVTLSRKAGTDGFSVPLSSSDPSAMVPQSIHIAGGSTSATFTVTTVPVATNTHSRISAGDSAVPVTATLTVKAPTLTAFTLSATGVTGGKGLTGTVKISSAAPAEGLSIAVTTDKTVVGLPQIVSVPAATTTFTFNISTFPVATKVSAKVTAKLGTSSIGVPLSITPPALSALTITPTSVAGGSSASGTVTLSGAAPDGGIAVSLTSSSTSATVPATVQVAAGATKVSFDIATKVVTAKSTAMITAKVSGGSATATLTILVAKKSKFAGSYTGVFYSPSGDVGTLVVTVSATGFVTGSSADDLSGSTTTLQGNVTDSGNATISTSGNGNNQSHIGTMAFNSAGYLVGQFSNSDQTTTTLTLTPGGKLLPLPGSYTGTFVSADTTGTVSITVTANGVLTGNASAANGDKVTLKGTCSPLGVIILTATSSRGGSDQNVGGCGYDATGKLIAILNNVGQNSTTTITLTKA